VGQARYFHLYLSQRSIGDLLDVYRWSHVIWDMGAATCVLICVDYPEQWWILGIGLLHMLGCWAAMILMVCAPIVAPACVDTKSCLEFTFPCPRENAHKRGHQHACKSQKHDTWQHVALSAWLRIVNHADMHY
jgi:hypothetical protein